MVILLEVLALTFKLGWIAWWCPDDLYGSY